MPKSPKKETKDDTRLALVKAIKKVTKTQQDFMKHVEAFQELRDELFNDLELKLEEKRYELKKLETHYEQQEQNRKVEVDLAVKEHGYNEAKKILEGRNEVAVIEEDYELLKTNYADLKRTKDQEVKKAVEAEQKRSERMMERYRETLDLQKKAELAKKDAELETQKKHISVLEDQIQGLKANLDAERQMIKEVAQAGASKPIQYLPSK